MNADTEEAKDVIVRLLSQTDNPALFRSVSSLAAQWKLDQAIPPLADALQSSDLEVKECAATALATFGRKALSALPQLNAQLDRLNTTLDAIRHAVDVVKP